MLKTYQFGANLKFRKSPNDAYGYEVGIIEVGELPASILNDGHQAVASEFAALRSDVATYDIQGVAWLDTDTGKVKSYGCMTPELMEEMDALLPRLLVTVH